MTHYIYEIINNENGKKYIGQTENSEKRQNQHMTNSHNSKLKKDVIKFGKEKFSFNILDEAECSISANFMEINTIEEVDSDKLYNISPGGQLVSNFDCYVCDECGNVQECRFGKKYREGIILFKVADYPSRVVERIFLLCGTCHVKHGYMIPACRDHIKYPYSKNSTANVLMDLVLNYDLSDEMIDKLMIVNGKMNIRMAYAFFTKRLGWK